MSADATPSGEIKQPMLSNHGRLVKAWRLTGTRGTVTYNAHLQDAASAGVYLDPGSGMFYARVPETDDGALYIAETLKELRAMLHPALEAWSKQREADERARNDEREWSRVIRVSYPPPSTRYCDWRGGNEHLTGRSYNKPGCLPEPSHRESDHIGPLHIVRVESALRPDGRYDVREWLEDYETRVARWQKRESPSEDPAKPVRYTAVEWQSYREVRSIYNVDFELPWSPETWAALVEFRQRISYMDTKIREFLAQKDRDAFLVGLLALNDGSRLLPGE